MRVGGLIAIRGITAHILLIDGNLQLVGHMGAMQKTQTVPTLAVRFPTCFVGWWKIKNRSVQNMCEFFSFLNAHSLWRINVGYGMFTVYSAPTKSRDCCFSDTLARTSLQMDGQAHVHRWRCHDAFQRHKFCKDVWNHMKWHTFLTVSHNTEARGHGK